MTADRTPIEDGSPPRDGHSESPRDQYLLSCDNVVALSDTTASGETLVGKNSDRPATEAQPLVYNTGGTHTSDETLTLAYRTIPQAEQTYATLGAAPYWCWGYEMGLNEHGVTLGNEAVFTRPLKARLEEFEDEDRTTTDDGAAPSNDRFPRSGDTSCGLLGMEFVRLGLERARTAAEAVEVVTRLLESHGQFGSAVATEDHESGAYDNSYLVADASEAWVLETAGRRWAAKRVSHGTAAISNELTIRDEWDDGSDDLVTHAVEQGWWDPEREPFDFSEAYTDHEVPRQVSRVRLQRSRQMLAAAARDGEVERDDISTILRDHYEDSFIDGPTFNAALPDFLTLCMHSSPAEFTWGNTVSSAVFDIPEDGIPTMWWTPIPPCVGVYIPFYVQSGGVPDSVSRAGTAGREVVSPMQATGDEYRDGSYWWEFMRLLRAVKGDEYGSAFEVNQQIARRTFDPLERRFASEAADVEQEALARLEAGDRENARSILSSFTAECVTAARQGVDEVLEQVE